MRHSGGDCVKDTLKVKKGTRENNKSTAKGRDAGFSKRDSQKITYAGMCEPRGRVPGS